MSEYINVERPFLHIIDYLIVHELTHLKYPNHTRQFWDSVFSVMPNYKECEEWLHDYGVTLSLE